MILYFLSYNNNNSEKKKPTGISQVPAFPFPDESVLFQNLMIAQVTLASCLCMSAQVSGDSYPYLIYTAAKLQDSCEAKQLCL